MNLIDWHIFAASSLVIVLLSCSMLLCFPRRYRLLVAKMTQDSRNSRCNSMYDCLLYGYLSRHKTGMVLISRSLFCSFFTFKTLYHFFN